MLTQQVQAPQCTTKNRTLLSYGMERERLQLHANPDHQVTDNVVKHRTMLKMGHDYPASAARLLQSFKALSQP